MHLESSTVIWGFRVIIFYEFARGNLMEEKMNKNIFVMAGPENGPSGGDYQDEQEGGRDDKG